MKFKELREANLTKAQIKKVHDKADELPKNDFIKRYGKDGDSVRFATATKMVKKELGIDEKSTEDKLKKWGPVKQLPPIKLPLKFGKPVKAEYEEESNLNEIVGGKGEMTITKDGGVMIIKTRDWQTYKAKGWEKKEEVKLDEIHWSNKGEPPAPKGMHKLRSGRDVPSSPKVDKIHKKVIAMTDRNDHSGARIELAKQVGDKQLAQVYSALQLIHDKYSGVVGNKSIELRHKFEPVLNNQLDRKFGKYADVLRDAL